MFLRLTPGPTAELVEPYDFTALKVLCSADTTGCEIEALGRRDEPDVFIDRDFLLRAGPAEDAGWVAGLDAMIESVRRLGWVDNSGAVRAHVEIE